MGQAPPEPLLVIFLNANAPLAQREMDVYFISCSRER